MKKKIAFLMVFAMFLGLLSSAFPFADIHAADKESWDFSYTGETEEWTAPYTGRYNLETWGAQGGGVLSKGGYTKGYINLYAGEKIWVTVGGKGAVAPKNGTAEGGYNGGGKAYKGAGSGGGATSITTEGRGELKNFESHKDEILLVAGGSAGKGSKTNLTEIVWDDEGKYCSTGNFYTDDATYREYVKTMGAGGGTSASGWYATHLTYEGYSSGFGQYKFAVGQDGSSTYNSGYSGAGGGGYYGGTTNYWFKSSPDTPSDITFNYAKMTGIIGGAGGSGYIDDIHIINGESHSNIQEGDGKAKITFEGPVTTTLTIDTKDNGTVDGKTGKVELKGLVGTSITIPEVIPNEGYKLYGYKVLYGDVDMAAGEYEFTFNDSFVEVQYISPLMIDLIKKSDTEYDIEFIEDDDIMKVYRVLQSFDGETWEPVLSHNNSEELKGYEKKFSYTGGVQSYTAPVDGYYYIEASGASGGVCARQGSQVYSRGGLTYGYRYLKKGQKIYVCVGGKGQSNNGSVTCERQSHQTAGYYYYGGGYNGGGSGFGDQCPSGGGGATSWTLTNRGVLANFNSYRNEVISVAGGSGGGNWGGCGYSGGGLAGVGGSSGDSYAQAGTQTSGYAFGHGGSRTNLADTPWGDAGGGGGGWYGGTSCLGDDGSGAGGSGYIGGLFNAESIAGAGHRSKVGVTPYGTAYISVYELIYNNNSLKNIVLYDNAAPNIPVDGKVQSNGDGLLITWNDDGDNGTDVKYKVISYKDGTDLSNPDTQEKLNESKELAFQYTSGVKGFYYYIDTKTNGTVTDKNIFTDSRGMDVPTATYDRYLHIAAVDNAGNISKTYDIHIPSIAKYTVNHYAQNEDGSYTLVETEEKMGQIGSTVTPDVIPQTGRDNPPAQSIVITADGKAQVDYYYDVTRFDAVGNISWNDHENLYGTRPDSIGVTIYRDGEYFDYVTVPTTDTVNKYSFDQLQKYDLETGQEFEYTVKQDMAYSQAALEHSEDKYTTIQNGFDFLNGIRNTERPVKPGSPDEPENPDDKGFHVEGEIYWDDNDDSLGFRPSEVTITIYQKGEDGEWKPFDEYVITDTRNDNHYIFDWLPKYWYDENDIPTAYEYKVEETFKAWYVKDGEIKDFYVIHEDQPNDFDFTNELIPDGPIIPVSEYVNTIIVKTNTDESVRIVLKPLEVFVHDDYSVSYGELTGNDIPVMSDKKGTSVSDLTGTRYEVIIDSPEYTLEDIKLSLAENMELEKIGDKWYVTILNVPADAIGTLEIELSKKEQFYQDRQSLMNYFSAGNRYLHTAEKIRKMSKSIAMPYASVLVKYMNSDTTDETIYMAGDKITILDYFGMMPAGSEFVGWSETENSVEAEYLPNIVIEAEKNLVLYPVFSALEEVDGKLKEYDSHLEDIVDCSDKLEEENISASY